MNLLAVRFLNFHTLTTIKKSNVFEVVGSLNNITQLRKSMETQTLQRCDNCMKEYPQSKMATHFGYCRRNIKKCDTCGQLYDINFKEDHEEEYHRKETCPHCKVTFPSNDYKKHEQNCNLKPKFCQYCDLNVPVASFATHFQACESRTKPCSKCNKPIMNKDYLVHLVSCNGPAPEISKPQNYQEHIMQQRRRDEPIVSPQQINNRQKYPIFSNGSGSNNIRGKQQYRPKEEIKPREQKYANIIQNGREKPQRGVEEQKRGIEHRSSYEQKIMQPPTRIQQKRQAPKYAISIPIRGEIKKQQRKIPTNNPVNPVRKQEYKQPTSGIISGSGRTPVTFTNNDPKRVINSREGVRPPVSQKDIFPTGSQLSKGPSVKDSKSMQRNIYNQGRKEEDIRNKYANQNIEPRVVQPQTKNRVPNPPVIVRNQPQIVVPQNPPQFSNQYSSDIYSSQYSMGGYQLSPEEQQLQKIIMESMKEHKGGNKPTKGPSYQKTIKPHYSSEIPYLQGEDIMNESFLEKQRAIQQQFSSKNKNRR